MDLLTLNSLPEELHNTIVRHDLSKGETLFRQGDPASSFFVVETGRIKLVRYIGDDKVVTFQAVEPGNSLGEIALFSHTYPCSAVAEVASQAIAYPKEPLLSAIRANPDFAEDFIAMLVQKIQDLKLRIELRDIRAAHERLLRYLDYLAQSNAQNIISFDRPLKEIATDLGLTPETLSRALARLEREGKIARTRLQITLQKSSAA
ncbi:cyclic nucleotide-binding domain-containing protein [Scytonema sp. UIC 10036]|uniref:Crp/Fnr family transcriptional regulator n=1 Tax=Scytonema sp. UIC 10036 TaxID=2304196 RepID=UPI0012DAF497|nr:Crp/Fnr family transcriptional regulator [Scytonema sp. UIC 10036]MUG99400.1 cyclic nucleotide-binding domain-containing protein [Scytonema sp. UIC 10036]